MSKCAECPIAGICVAERPEYGFACKFAAGSESEKSWLANQSAKVQDVPVEYPTVGTQVVTAVKALGKFVASGLKTVDNETYQERLAVCSNCPQWDAERRRCRACGCKTDYKLRMASESCPEGRWSPAVD